MKPSDSEKDFYLDPSFDYSKLTKMELRDIMSINNIDEIPPLSAKKDVILHAYKNNIHDRIEQIRKARNFSRENIFQSESEMSDVNEPSQRRGSIARQQKTHRRQSIGSIQHDSSNRNSEDIPADSHHSDNSSFFDNSDFSSFKENASKPQDGAAPSAQKHGGANSSQVEDPRSEINQSVASRADATNRSDMSNASNILGNASNIRSKSDAGNISNILSRSNIGHLSCLRSDQNASGVSNRSFVSEASNRSFLSPPCSASSVKTKPPTSTTAKPVYLRVRKALMALLLLALLWYLKFRSPYCEHGKKWCIPLPSNSHILNGRMVCNPGFIKIKSVIDHCAPESMRVYQAEALRIVRELEYMHGEYVYKMRTTPDVLISALTRNQKVIKILKDLSHENKGSNVLSTDIHKKMVIFNDNRIQAARYRVSARCFLKFYASILIKILASILVVYILTRLTVRRLRQNRIYRSEATETMKDINEMLSRQLLVALRTNLIRPYVYIEQVKSVLNISDNAWYYVKELVNSSCNVEVKSDEDGRIQWKWIGPILLKGEADDSSNNNIF